MTDPEDTDPEVVVDVPLDELIEHEVDVTDDFERPLPVEADELDAVDQKRAVPDPDEDEYRD